MVILGLGSNLGDRASGSRIAALTSAIRLISERRCLTQIRRSCVIETPALLPPGAPVDWDKPFLNLALSGETSFSPAELLRELKRIERELGRPERHDRWAPREIDIDILAWDALTVDSPDLCVPHRGLVDRDFAIIPLAELVHGWRYPAPGPHFGKTAKELAARFGRHPRLVGILNITPDSFSDGARFDSPNAALTQARELVAAGADVLDIGAESTRPGAVAISPEAELQRLEPVLSKLDELRGTALVSVDTRHVLVAERALKAGVDWINDVSGLADPALRELVARSGVDVVVMHSLSVPADPKRVLPQDTDPVQAVIHWGENRLRELERSGIPRDHVIVDPGIGFGKTAAQSLRLLQDIDRLESLGARVLVGHSRKSFFSLFADTPAKDRDIETLAASMLLALRGVDYLRVHNVGWHIRAMRVARAFAGKPGNK